MKFIVDNQLPVALARWLSHRGHDSVHVIDVGLDQKTDSIIWSRALAEARIVVSKDDDFLLLANRPNDHGKLLWVHVGNCRTVSLLELFAASWPSINKAFTEGQRIVEIR